MPEGLKLIVTSDVTQAEQNLKKFVATAGKEGERAATSLTTGLNKINPAAAKTFGNLSTQAKSAIKPISLLGDSIETLRAKLLARKEFLIKATDIGQIRVYNNEIKLLESEILKLQSVGSSSLGAIGKAGKEGFSFLRTAANILPGIGIAGIFGLAFEGISSLFSGVSKESEELAKKLKELIIPIHDIKDAATAGTAEELSKVTALTNAVLNQSLSYNERNAALNQLKEINKGYFGDLTVETAALGLLKTRVEEYTKAIISAAVIKAFSEDIGKLTVELSKQKKAWTELSQPIKGLQDQVAKAGVAAKNSQSELAGFASGDAIVKLGKATGAFESQRLVVGKLALQLRDLQNAMQDAVNESLTLKPLDEKVTKIPKAKREIEFIPKFDLKKLDDLLKKESGFNKISLNIQGEVIPEVHVKKTDADKLFDELKKQVSSKALIQPVEIPAKVVFDAKLLEAQMNDLNKILAQGFADIFAGIGETIATGDITNVTKVLGSVIQQIGKALIQYGIVKTGLDKILTGGVKIPGAVAIGLGIAAVAIGQLIKNAKPQGFKEGGFTGFGSPNEIAGVVHRGEFVIPASILKKMNSSSQPNLAGLLGNGPQVIILNAEISGTKIKLVEARTGRSQKRLSAA